MCSALGEEEPKYVPLAEAAGKLMADIDVKANELRQAEDVLTRARAPARSSVRAASAPRRRASS